MKISRSNGIRVLIFWGLVTLCPTVRADLSSELVARWTFNRPGNGVWTDDISGLELKAIPGKPNQKITFNPDGTLTIGKGALLVAAGVNSQNYPDVKKGITIWTRIKVEKEIGESVVFGLLDAVTTAEWEQQVFSAKVGKNKDLQSENLGFLGHGEDRKEFGIGSQTVDLKPGWITLAMAFDGFRKTAVFYVNGTVVERKTGTASVLQEFQSFAVGSLKSSSGTTFDVDEIRIYKIPLSPDWINEIEPVPSNQ